MTKTKKILSSLLLASTLMTPMAAHAVLSTFTVTSDDAEIQEIGLAATGNGWQNAGSSGSNTYDYVAINFTADASGSYTFGQTSAPVDTAMAVYYNGAYDINALVNPDAYDDDTGGAGNTCGSPSRCPEVTANLVAGQTNTLVITTFSHASSLAFPLSFFADGVGNISFVVNTDGTAYFVPVSNAGTTDGAASVLDALLADTSGLPSDLATVLTSLRSQSDTARATALQRITPNTSVAISNASGRIVSGGFSEIGGRLGAVRSFQGGGNTVTTGVNSGDTTSIWDSIGTPNSFWGQVYGHKGKQGLSDGFAGYESLSKSVMVGYDIVPAQNWIIGAAFGYADTTVDMADYRDGDETSIDSYQFSLYGSYEFIKDWALDLVGSYARHEYKSKRNTSQDIAKSEFGGNHYGLRADISRAIPLNNSITITPKAGLEWTTLKQEGYEETESALAQRMEASTTHRLKSGLSLEARKEIKTEDGTTFFPNFRIGWDHEFKERAANSTSSFVGGGDSFTTKGQAAERNRFNLRAGMEIHKQDNLQFDIGFDGDFADDYHGYGAQLQVKWTF